MQTIVFDKPYYKLLDSQDDVIEHARLLNVFSVNYKELPWSLRDYDNEPRQGADKYDMLIFLKPEDELWDTSNLFITFRKHRIIFKENIGKLWKVVIGPR